MEFHVLSTIQGYFRTAGKKRKKRHWRVTTLFTDWILSLTLSQARRSLRCTTRYRKSSEVNTSQHKSSQVITSQHKSSQVITSQHELSQVNTSQHKSSQVITSYHKSTQVLVWLTGADTCYFVCRREGRKWSRAVVKAGIKNAIFYYLSVLSRWGFVFAVGCRPTA